MPVPNMSAMESVLQRLRELESRVRLLERLNTPTKVRRAIPEWLNENYSDVISSSDVIKGCNDRDNLISVLRTQGLNNAIMALWTKVFIPDAEDCPLRCYNVAPLNIYTIVDGKWIVMGPSEFKMLNRVSEQWMLRAIATEHGEKSDTAMMLREKVLNPTCDMTRLRTRLGAYLRRTLREVKEYVFEP
jgi:hypothetical protein